MDRGQIMTLRKENSTIRKQRAYGQTTHSKSWSWKEGRKWYWWHLWLTVGRHSYLGIFHFPSHFCDFPSMPVFSARKPHAWNIHINDCRVFVGFEDKNNQILPLQVSTESMELVCTYKYCHHSSRDICFGPVFIYLFPTIQSHLWFLRLIGSYFTVGWFCSLPIPPLPQPPRSDSRAVLSNRIFFDYGNVLYLHVQYRSH